MVPKGADFFNLFFMTKIEAHTKGSKGMIRMEFFALKGKTCNSLVLNR